MNTGDKQNLIQYIIWHFSTKLQALKGFLNPNEEITKEMERCKTVLNKPEEEVDNWIYKEGTE